MLAEGVVEGRKTFGNTMKYVMMGISSNFGNMFSVAGAALFLAILSDDFHSNIVKQPFVHSFPNHDSN